MCLRNGGASWLREGCVEKGRSWSVRREVLRRFRAGSVRQKESAVDRVCVAVCSEHVNLVHIRLEERFDMVS